MKLPHTEVKFYPKVKSQTGLSSLRVSCKHGLIVVGLVNSPICAVINVTCAICVIYPSKHLLVQGKNTNSKRWEIYSLTSLMSFGVYIVDFEPIFHIFLLFLVLILNRHMFAWIQLAIYMKEQ